MRLKIAIILTFFAFIKICSSEYFSSVEELKGLRVTQRKYINLLKDLSKELEKSHSYVQRKIKEIEDEHQLLIDDQEAYFYHPLNGFSLIARLTHGIDALQKKMTPIADLYDKIDKIKLPAEELDGAAEGIFRLQETYQLKTEDFVRGNIHNKKYRKEMTPQDALILGGAMGKYDQKYAAEYVEAARKLTRNFDLPVKLDYLHDIFEFYNSTAKYKEAVEILDEIHKFDPENSKYEEQRMSVELLSLYVDDKKEVKPKVDPKDLQGAYYTAPKEFMIFSKACRGELSKSVQEQSKLFCRYVSKTAYSKLAPFKVIEANLDPYMAIYVDVINDDEIDVLRIFASRDLKRASVMTTNTTSKVSRVRIAKLNWQQESKHEVYARLTKRVYDMTGLSMTTAEQWQTQNYGIGGFYGPHHDFASEGQRFNDQNGNRIATTLFYLTDVEKGGGTVFPFLNIHVPPMKGAAVFWYNMNTSGERDYMTRHAACPVLFGSKWVANKWIRERDQEFIRPCEVIKQPSDEKYYLRTYNLKDYGIVV